MIVYGWIRASTHMRAVVPGDAEKVPTERKTLAEGAGFEPAEPETRLKGLASPRTRPGYATPPRVNRFYLPIVAVDRCARRTATISEIADSAISSGVSA